jgi:hypothetical protein
LLSKPSPTKARSRSAATRSSWLAGASTAGSTR